MVTHYSHLHYRTGTADWLAAVRSIVAVAVELVVVTAVEPVAALHSYTPAAAVAAVDTIKTPEGHPYLPDVRDSDQMSVPKGVDFGFDSGFDSEFGSGSDSDFGSDFDCMTRKGREGSYQVEYYLQDYHHHYLSDLFGIVAVVAVAVVGTVVVFVVDMV